MASSGRLLYAQGLGNQLEPGVISKRLDFHLEAL